MTEESAATAETTAAAAAAKKEKKVPEGLVIPPKKPKLSKAERRALQEQQRAAKAGGTAPPAKPTTVTPPPSAIVTTRATTTTSTVPPTDGDAGTKAPPTTTTTPSAAVTSTPVRPEPWRLVAHLPLYQDVSTKFSLGATLHPLTTNPSYLHLHPVVWKLGYQYASGEIRGGNARCRAMLDCFAQVVQDYVPEEASTTGTTTTDLRQALDHDVLKPSFQFWTEFCRPHSVSMGNAFSFLKTVVAALPRDQPYPLVQETLVETMHAYVKERLTYADQAIANLACEKLSTHEVVLVYGHSEAICSVLQRAHAQHKHLRVMVVDSEPLYEGQATLHWLRHHCPTLTCTYVPLASLSYVLPRVHKVLLGAAALLSDGSVVGRVGTAVVALCAHRHRIPVLVCSETYKISHRIQLEGLTHNELLGNNNSTSTLETLHVLYDWTPAALVSGIVTELGLVPPTSVAVLLREMNLQDLKR
jgi:translation initiation factor eIF-2B subunit delta